MKRIPALASFTISFRCLLVAGIAIPGVAAAQGLFAFPPDRADYSKYMSAEACLAAVARVQDSTERVILIASGVLPGTVPNDPDAAPAPPVLETARNCHARYQRPPMPAELNSRERYLHSLFRLELAAGRDAAADSVLWRQLSALYDESSAEHGSVLLAAALAYLYAPPARIAAAERVMAVLDSVPGGTRAQRDSARSALLSIATAKLDTALMRRGANALAAGLREAPESERTTRLWRALERQFIDVQAILAVPVLRDGGATAYLAHLRSAYSSALNVSPEAAAEALAPIGEKAPALEGEYWFRGDAPRPAPGQPAIVYVWTRTQSEPGRYGQCICAPDYAFLRRVSDRFGARLDLTTMTKTYGFFGDRLRTPAEEAEALRHYIHDRADVPGALGVEVTQFTKLPDPDRRRINALTANENAYRDSYVKKGFFPGGIIVASDGAILFGFPANRAWQQERGLMAMLDALVGPVRATIESSVPATPATGSSGAIVVVAEP